MDRNSTLRRFVSSLRDKGSSRVEAFRPRLEPLEERRMLAGQDLLVGTYDDTAGLSVLRYNDTTYTAAAGSVATGNNGLNTVQGLAVAPDGSFYVSSADLMSFSGSVFHYDAAGNYLDKLGENDAFPATIVVPGTLAFGPNGHLYVGDLGAQVIYEFDTSSTTQQFVGTPVTGFTPGAFAFATDGSDDLLVANLDTQSIIAYHTDNTSDTILGPGSGYNVGSILPMPNGDMYLADFAFQFESPTSHHQIVKYTAATESAAQFIDLTFPVGTGGSAGFPPQPTSLLLDHDGNLLVGLSPDHNFNGAVQKYDIDDGSFISTLVSGIGSPSALAFIDSVSSAVADRKIFYHNSTKWNVTNNNLPGFSDDNAIAPDKTAYIANGAAATFANVSSYTRGINGVMIDVAGAHGTITANDFLFKAGNNNSPSTWGTAAAPTTVTTRSGAGVGGSDRVELIWANGAVANTWLEIIVRGNDTLGGSNTNTGLTASDVFFFGSAPGDSGAGDTSGFLVNATDETSARNDPHGVTNPATIADVNDFDRNGLVNSTDQGATRTYATSVVTQLKFLTVGAGGPFAPNSSDGDSGVATALAAASATAAPAVAPGLPTFKTDLNRIAAVVHRKLDEVRDSFAARSPKRAEVLGKVLDELDVLLARFGID